MLSEHVTHMPLLTTLQMKVMDLRAVVSAATHLHSSCPALTKLTLVGISGERGWGDLWSALAGARSLRRLDIKRFDLMSRGVANLTTSDVWISCIVWSWSPNIVKATFNRRCKCSH